MRVQGQKGEVSASRRVCKDRCKAVYGVVLGRGDACGDTCKKPSDRAGAGTKWMRAGRRGAGGVGRGA
jgi:hypothetical protein